MPFATCMHPLHLFYGMVMQEFQNACIPEGTHGFASDTFHGMGHTMSMLYGSSTLRLSFFHCNFNLASLFHILFGDLPPLCGRTSATSGAVAMRAPVF